MREDSMGRVVRPPHPQLFELLYEPGLEKDRRFVLPHLLAIDAAHVVMLQERGLLAPSVAARLLTLNRELAGRVEAGESPLGQPPSHRGLYVLYESELIRRLGPEVGGAAHLARSRNDINGAVTRLRARHSLWILRGHLLGLLESLVRLAEAHVATLMSGFTHLEPAQPTSFGHYLAGVSWELLRSAEWLAEAGRRTDQSPLGAGAGFGTSLPIDPPRVARLLGFAGVIPNSLDAVASRDFLVHGLAATAMLGISLTRLATDLQVWSSSAYGFVGWPDELVSSSSIMPQKRNAYVLENVRGQATGPVGALVSTLAGLKNVPFTNSVEVSGEAAGHFEPAVATASKALRLMTLLIDELEVHGPAMAGFLAGRQTTMTALANLLVTELGLPFRTAHEAVGRVVNELPPGEPAPEEVVGRLNAVLADLSSTGGQLDPATAARALDPRRCLEAAAHGGGPAPTALRRQLADLGQRRDELQREVESEKDRARRSGVLLTEAVAAAVAEGEGSGADPKVAAREVEGNRER